MQLIYQYTFLNVVIHINYSVVELPSNEKEADPEVPEENASSEEEDELSPETPDDENPSDEGNDEENSVAQDQGVCKLM